MLKPTKYRQIFCYVLVCSCFSGFVPLKLYFKVHYHRLLLQPLYTSPDFNLSLPQSCMTQHLRYHYFALLCKNQEFVSRDLTVTL
jgi:hypothetical protein